MKVASAIWRAGSYKNILFNNNASGRAIFLKLKTLKNHGNFSENMVVGLKFHAISLWKSDHFPKNYTYSERGSSAASSYDKSSTSIFSWKTWFSEGGGPLKTTIKQILVLWVMNFSFYASFRWKNQTSGRNSRRKSRQSESIRCFRRVSAETQLNIDERDTGDIANIADIGDIECIADIEEIEM